ncbi:MAG: hypothetical protein P8P19_06845 [Polaribacter sp.]|jgi:hypothetical protein|nr:hypothetical protein [Polaribacter sp.]MBT5099376.1 hypothetical protein [Polaribacter sp.]MBT5644817.1 hypothetical protein [Polaribacter sp.]MBT7705767.1 hypothetical protein [Polaribacter sp.]MDB4009501.1 hypothetical protein [Polaribacter sp.]
MEDKIIESIGYLLPAAVTGYIAYYMFNRFVSKTDGNTRANVLAKKNKVVLTVKLQAYERMLLFSDRINPTKILVRIPPISENTQEYLQLLMGNIEQEFEHNLVQQMYVSTDAWTAVVGAKNAVLKKLKHVAESAKNANALRETVLIDYSKSISPTETAIAIIKNDVKKLLK